VRRALIGAVVASLALAAAAQAAPARRTIVQPEAVVGQPALLGSSLFYEVRTRRLDIVKRLDLGTLQSTPLYTLRSASVQLAGRVHAGGGRVALDVQDVNPRGGFGSKVVELDPAGGPPRTVVRGLLRSTKRRNCGTEVSLEDVSQDGALLIDKASLGCGRRATARHVLRRYAAGPPAILSRYTERSSDESPYWRLAGTHLLEASERGARITDLVTRGVRQVRPGRHFQNVWADLDAAGNAVVGDQSVRGRAVREIVRLAAGRVLLDTRDSQAQPQFCGNRLVMQTVSRTKQELLVYDDLAAAPRVPFSVPRNSPDTEIQLSCDADTAVLTDYQRGKRTVIEVVPLTP
jgi:hypothetical protein